MTAVPGGRYVRDPNTGKLTPLAEDAPLPAAPASAPSSDAPPSDPPAPTKPEPKKGK